MADEKRIKQYELNKKLYDACVADKVDYDCIKQLFSEGAEPLGITELGGSNVYEEMLLTLVDYEKPQALYDVTKLFLDRGMDIVNPPEPYDHNSINPLWSFAFSSENMVIDTLKLLLDAGIDADAVGQCWHHIVDDVCFAGGSSVPLNEGGMKFYFEDLHKIFLIASYPHILSKDEALKKFIWFDRNDYDLSNFRDWSKFSFKIDTCAYSDSIYKAIVVVVDENENEVWRFRFGE